MRSILKKLQRLAFCVVMLPCTLLGQGQPGITNVDSYTVFRTGTNDPLLTFSLTSQFPNLGLAPTISFEFGFATEETNALAMFMDSFSLALQASNQSATVFSADQTGVAWAPNTPGGLDLGTNGLLINPIAFTTNSLPGLPLSPSLRFAYNVSLFLPGPLSSSPLSIFFDFFDNLNGVASMAYLIGVRLDATGSLGTKARFYRLNSTIPIRIDALQDTLSAVLLAYHFDLTNVVLQSAQMLDGPFLTVTNAVLDVAKQSFVVPCPDTNKFYRIVSITNATIVSITATGMNLYLEYDFDTNVAPVRVEAALTVAIPTNANARFFERPDTRAEATRRRLRVAKPGFVLPPPPGP